MPLLHKIKKIFGGRIVTQDADDNEELQRLERLLEQAKRLGDSNEVKELEQAIEEVKKAQSKDGILQDFTNFLMEPTEKAASGDSAVVFSSEEAQEIAAKAGVDLTKYDLGEFCRGLEVELEHSDLTAGDPSMTAKIVVAHLNEIPDYYTRLEKMESEAKATTDSMRMTNDPKERGKQKELFRGLYPDYDPKRHDAFVVRYNQEEDKKNTLEYMKNRGIKDSLSDFDRKQKERGKIYKIILPAGMGEPLYTGSAQAAIEMAKEYGKGTRVENLSETTDGGMDFDQYQRMKKEQLDDLKYAQEKGDKELEKRARATLAMIEQDWKESKDSAFKRFKDKKACVRDAVRRLRYKGTTDGGVGSGIKGHVTAKQIAAMKARKEAQSAQKPSAKKGGLSAKEIEGLKKNAVSTKTVFVQFDKRTNSFTQMRSEKGQDDKTGTLTWHQVNFYKSSDEKIKPLDLSHVNRAHGNGGILLRSKNEGKNVLGLVEIVKEKNKSGASDKTTDGGVGSGIKGHVTAKQIAAMKPRK